MIKTDRDGYRGKLSQRTIVFRAIIVGVIMFVWTVGCSSGPVQSPEQFVKAFIEKHVTMVDVSTADFYVKGEQPGIRELINQSIKSKKDEGVFDSLKDASYDFSNVNVKVLAKKTDYVNDEEARYVKLQAKGNYTLTTESKTEMYNEDEIFVLRSVGNEWKLTEKENPWK